MKKGLVIQLVSGLIIKETEDTFLPVMFEKEPITIDLIKEKIKASNYGATYLLVPIEKEILLTVRELYLEQLKDRVKTLGSKVPKAYLSEVENIEKSMNHFKNLISLEIGSEVSIVEVDSIHSKVTEVKELVFSLSGYSVKGGVTAVETINQTDYSKKTTLTTVVFSIEDLDAVNKFQRTSNISKSTHISFEDQKEVDATVSELSNELVQKKIQYIKSVIDSKSDEIKEDIKAAKKNASFLSDSQILYNASLESSLDKDSMPNFYITGFPNAYVSIEQIDPKTIEYKYHNAAEFGVRGKKLPLEKFKKLKNGDIFEKETRGKYTDVTFVKYIDGNESDEELSVEAIKERLAEVLIAALIPSTTSIPFSA